MNRLEWDIKNQNGESIGLVLGLLGSTEPFAVVTKSLDGTPYVQTVGAGTKTASVTVFADTHAKKSALDYAAETGELLTVTYNGAVRYGYINGQIGWEYSLLSGSSRGQFTLLEVQP